MLKTVGQALLRHPMHVRAGKYFKEMQKLTNAVLARECIFLDCTAKYKMQVIHGKNAKFIAKEYIHFTIIS